MLTHIDLFSGIGGFALAAQWTGFKTIAFVEIDEYCQEIIKQNFGAFMANTDQDGRRERCAPEPGQKGGKAQPSDRSDEQRPVILNRKIKPWDYDIADA